MTNSQPKKILLIEDEERLVKVLKILLESAAFEVVWASSGDQGLKMARSEEPALIILDVMLPIMDGYKICRLLKFDKRFQNIPILMLTSRSGPYDKELSEEVLADEYITKPFDHRKLLSLIKRLIEKRETDNLF